MHEHAIEDPVIRAAFDEWYANCLVPDNVLLRGNIYYPMAFVAAWKKARAAALEEAAGLLTQGAQTCRDNGHQAPMAEQIARVMDEDADRILALKDKT